VGSFCAAASWTKKTCPVFLEKAAGRRKTISANYSIAWGAQTSIFHRFDFETPLMKSLNAELTKKALEKVGNPNVLVNLISRRVRQLTSGGGASSRPLVADVGNLGAADIALLEIIEEKMGFDMPEVVELTRPVSKKRKKH
jgi:DNA-directed RNA polymerase subunit omega